MTLLHALRDLGFAQKRLARTDVRQDEYDAGLTVPLLFLSARHSA